jgi:hypothetical protein
MRVVQVPHQVAGPISHGGRRRTGRLTPRLTTAVRVLWWLWWVSSEDKPEQFSACREVVVYKSGSVHIWADMKNAAVWCDKSDSTHDAADFRIDVC